MFRKFVCPALCSLLLLAAPRVFAQDPPPVAAEAIKITTELVILDAAVLKKTDGKIVGTLKKEDFQLYENGVAQEITHFSYDQLPLSIVLLLDISGSVSSIIERLQATALETLQRLKPEDEVALIAFANDVWLIQDFTTDRALLAQMIASATSKSYRENALRLSTGQGGTLIGEGIYQAATHFLKTNDAKRRAIIVVTDNLPTDTRPPHSKAEVTEQLLESDATLYGLIVRDLAGKAASVSQRNPLNIFTEKVIFKSAGNVNGYADKTGGQVLTADKEAAAARFAELIERLRTRYSLGYAPTNAKFDGQFRRLKLQVSAAAAKREGAVVVRTRPGYYARARSKVE